MKKKILVADDEPLFVELLTARLTAAGYAVCTARDGEEAFAVAKKEKPLLIVMDVMMPRTSGFEAMQKIRQCPETQEIPAIVFSGKAGMKDFFTDMFDVEFMHKPFDAKLLIGRIEALIGNSAQSEGQPKHIVLIGVEEPIVNKIRDFFIGHNFQVLIVLNESEAVALSKKFRPSMILCQFWEDENILDPRKIAKELLLHPEISETPLYVYCKDSLSLEALKYFKSERIIAYNETSSLLRKLETITLPSSPLSGSAR